jgi:hypothetical protein
MEKNEWSPTNVRSNEIKAACNKETAEDRMALKGDKGI